jgi:CSLREA domain-containing protein
MRDFILRTLSTLFCFWAPLALIADDAAHAAIHVVNSTADASDTVAGDGLCDTGATVEVSPGVDATQCTLRAAIEESNAALGGVVRFASTLSIASGIIEIVPTTPLQDARRIGHPRREVDRHSGVSRT